MTTPVGSIKLTLTIDGSNVDQQITQAVRKQMGPILAELNAQLKETSKQYNAVGDAAEKAGAKQAAANKSAADSMKPSKQIAGYEAIARAAKDAADAIERIAAAEKLRDKGVADSAARVAAMDREAAAAQREARDMTELAGAAYAAALAVDKLAAANARAAAGPKPSYKPPTGGGGGRGTASDGGGLFGDKGLLGKLPSGTILNGLSLGATALQPATLAITNLAGAIQTLAQGALVLPGVFAGIGASVGTAALGMNGMTDAVKDMWKAMSENDPKKQAKDWQKFQEDLQGLAPSARETVLALKGLGKPLQDLQNTLQGNMFDGVAGPLKQTVDKLLPSLTTGMTAVSKAWNGTFKSILGAAGSDSSKSFLDRIFGNTADAQTRANAAIAPLTHAFGQLATTGTNFLPRLADGLTKVSTRFDNFISSAAADGRLDHWINDGITAMSSFGNSILNIGKIFTDITKAAGGDGGFFKMLETGTGKLAAFLGSAEGQQKLTDFFNDARQRMAEWLPVLKDMASVAKDVFDGFKQWGDVLLPIIGGIASGLSAIPSAVANVVTGLLALKTINPILESTAGLIGRIRGGLPTTPTGSGVPGGAPGTGSPAGGLGFLDRFQRFSSGALLATAANSVASDLFKAPPGELPGGWQTAGASSVDVLGTAAGGALMGSAAGPWGAAIGGAIGALVGGVHAFITSINTAGSALNSLPEKLRQWNIEHPLIPPGTGIGTKLPDIMPVSSDPNAPAPTLNDLPAVDQNGRLIPQITDADGNLINDPDRFRKGLPVNPFAPNPILNGRDQDKYTLRDDSADTNPFSSLAVPPNFLARIAPQIPQGQLPAAALPQGAGPVPVQIVNPSLPSTAPPGVQQPTDLGSLLGAGPANAGTPVIKPTVDPKAQQDISNLATSIKDMNGEVHITSPDIPKVKQDLDGVNAKIDDVSKNEIVVKANDDQAKGVLDALIQSYQGRTITLNVTAGSAPSSPPVGPGHADGGVIPGWSPGRDNVLWPLSGGEGILIPEAVRGLGGPAGVWAINSQFRAGLSRQGYADGGVAPGGLPALGGGDVVVSLLTQIRDLLAAGGRGGEGRGVTGSPRPGGVGRIPGVSGAQSGAQGGKRNLLWDTAASFISMFGGDPYSILGPDPSGAGPAGAAGGVSGMSSLIGPLSQFAHTGQYGADLSAAGIEPNSQIIHAITAARGRKKNGMSDDQIGGLIDQVLGTGTYNGQIDTVNKPLINALMRLNGVPSTGTLPGTGTRAAGEAAGVPAGGRLTASAAGAPVPVYIVNGPGGGAIGNAVGKAGLDSVTQGLASALGIAPDILGKVMNAAVGVGQGDPTGKLLTGKPDTAAAAVANLLGFNVSDLSRKGGGANPLMLNQGPESLANGQVLSDSSISVDRTLTSTETANQARFKQQMQVLDQSRDLLTSKFLTPTMQTAVTDGINGLSQAIQTAIGSSMGEAAAGPIASAVSTAVASSSGGSATTQGYATGGVLPGYSPGVDNMLVPMSGGEGVLIPEAVRALGGAPAIYAINSRFRAGISRQGYASGGVVNDTIGATLLGVDQVPIISEIVNLIVSIFLQVIGLQLKSLNTLTDMSKEIKQFRGDFKESDATGRLYSDTASLTARSATSKEVQNAQTMYMWEQIIIGALKFVIEDILIPLIKTAISSAINFASQAISGAIGAAASGVSFGAGGGLASGLANAGVSAIANIANQAADIFVDILGKVLVSGVQSIIPAIGSLISDLFPNLLVGFTTLMGNAGKIITGIFDGILSPFTAIGHALGLFDEGGIAQGVGYMPKGTLAPERVLSPQQTASFDRLVDSLTSNRVAVGSGPQRQITIHAGGISVSGGEGAGQRVVDELLSLVTP